MKNGLGICKIFFFSKNKDKTLHRREAFDNGGRQTNKDEEYGRETETNIFYNFHIRALGVSKMPKEGAKLNVYEKYRFKRYDGLCVQ